MGVGWRGHPESDRPRIHAAHVQVPEVAQHAPAQPKLETGDIPSHRRLRRLECRRQALDLREAVIRRIALEPPRSPKARTQPAARAVELQKEMAMEMAIGAGHQADQDGGARQPAHAQRPKGPPRAGRHGVYSQVHRSNHHSLANTLSGRCRRGADTHTYLRLLWWVARA